MNFTKVLQTSKKWKGTNSKKYLIIHHTAVADFEASCRVLSGNTGEVSVHYVVGLKGETAKIGEDSDILWHVGYSKWQGQEDLNRFCIGIEICSEGEIFTPEQKAKVAELIRELIAKYKIPAENILRHADVSGFRGKWDVAPVFYEGEFGTWKNYQDSFREQFPSPDMAASWGKAVAKKLVTKDPKGQIIATDLETILVRLGALNKQEGNLSRERLMVGFDRLKLLDN